MNFKLGHVIVVLALLSIVIGADPRQFQGMTIKLWALLVMREVWEKRQTPLFFFYI